MSKNHEMMKDQGKNPEDIKKDAAVARDSIEDILELFRMLREKQTLYQGDIVAEIRADRIERYRHF